MADQIPEAERRRILAILAKRKQPKPPKPPPPFQWVAIRVGTMEEEDPAQTGQGKANYTPTGAEENTMSDKKLPPPSPAQQKAVCEVGERVLKEPPPKPEKK